MKEFECRCISTFGRWAVLALGSILGKVWWATWMPLANYPATLAKSQGHSISAIDMRAPQPSFQVMGSSTGPDHCP